MIHVLLYGPEYRPNLSSMIRTAEFYGCDRVYIYDKNNLLLPPEHSKKARADMAHMAKVWTAGAIDHIEVVKVEDIDDFLNQHHGRIVGTMVDPTAKVLHSFAFEEGDLILWALKKRDCLTQSYHLSMNQYICQIKEIHLV